MAAGWLSEGGARYRRLLDAVDAALLPAAENDAHELTSSLTSLTRRGTMPLAERALVGLPVSSFDLISGLSGTVLYLLSRKESPPARRVAEVALSALAALAGSQDGIPLWHTPLRHLWKAEEVVRYPRGNLNCGLAHGAPGVLAALSIGLLEGVEVPSQRAAIGVIAEWLLASTVEDSWGPNWPSMLSTELFARGDARSAEGARAAWCYGAPGVCRSLWLAGRAVEETRYTETAVEGMLASCRRPAAKRGIPSPTFCHGQAGWIAILHRMALDCAHPEIVATYHRSFTALVDRFDPTLPLGYQSIETDDVRVDNPGLLDGAAGIALVLLAPAVGQEEGWDRSFALS